MFGFWEGQSPNLFQHRLNRSNGHFQFGTQLKYVKSQLMNKTNPREAAGFRSHDPVWSNLCINVK